MARRGMVVAVAAGLLAAPVGCGGESGDTAYTPLRAAQLSRVVEDVGDAARRGDARDAKARLDRVRAVVAAHAERGEIDSRAYARVRDAIRGVEEELR